MRSLFSLLILISLCFASVGCAKKKRISGKEYVSKEVLVDVLVDIHLIDGITDHRNYLRKYNYIDSIDLITPIFNKHQITKEKFDSTIAEYSRHPELLDQVYDEVMMKLNVMLDDTDTQQTQGGAADGPGP